jgi:hypothetical protein
MAYLYTSHLLQISVTQIDIFKIKILLRPSNPKINQLFLGNDFH